ncbi:MAG: hypothetical protein ACTSPL_08545 [Candidatus Odinarchaeia archaeon]
MSFNLTNSAYLNDISVLIEEDTLGGASLILNIYNSTWVNGKPKPDKTITPFITVNVPHTGVGNYVWANTSLSSPLLLDINKTENNTFFISLVSSSSTYEMYWGQVNNGNQGYAYDFETGEYLDLDFILKANVSANILPYDPESVFPTNISLSINGTAVSDTVNVGEGFCEIFKNSNESSSGFISFNVTSTWMAPVNYTVTFTNVTYGKYVDATTTYSVDAGLDASWNVTVVATGSNGFPQNTTIVHNFVNVTVPSDWSNITDYAFNEGNTSQSYYLSEYISDHRLVFEAENGTWTLMCGAPNYVSGINVFNRGHNVTGIGAVLIDFLSINVTLNNSVVSGGDANISIYDSSMSLAFTNATSGITSDNFAFPLDVLNNISSAGVYNITVFFNSTFEVGYGEISSFRVNSSGKTKLTVLDFDQYAEPSQLVNITIYFERGDIGEGITGISDKISVTGDAVLNSVEEQGNGVYVLHITFPSEGYHIFKVTIQGVNYFEDAESPSITVLYGAPPSTPISALIMLFLSLSQSDQRLNYMLSIIGLTGVVVAVGVGGFIANNRRKIPYRALSSLENIIVDHVPTGITLWAFDFFKMEQDVTLVSGFMSAVKSFLGEMKKGGLRKLETEHERELSAGGELD